MRHLDRSAELELASSITALQGVVAHAPRTSPYADHAPSASSRRAAAEDWFIESVNRLAQERQRSYTSAADALLSIRRDVRLALESSPLPPAWSEGLLERATDVAVDVLLSQHPSDRGSPKRHD